MATRLDLLGLNEEEKTTLKGGGTPGHWSKARMSQIDLDGRWTIKRGRKRKPKPGQRRQAEVEIAVPAFGYKNHVTIDRRQGLVRRFRVTHAATHDGRQLREVLDPDNTASPVWADSAYRSNPSIALLERRGSKPEFQHRKPRGRDMPDHLHRGNATRSRIRSHVEHVFAGQKHRMGLTVRSVGITRAKAKIGLANHVYNMQRLAWLKARPQPT